jgi:hypothetical protein
MRVEVRPVGPMPGSVKSEHGARLSTEGSLSIEDSAKCLKSDCRGVRASGLPNGSPAGQRIEWR